MKHQTESNGSTRLGGELISARVVERLAQEMRSGLYAGHDRLPWESAVLLCAMP